MCSATKRTPSEWVGLALEGLATAAIIGLAFTLAFGSVTLLLAHLCVVPLAPWCRW